MESKLFERIQEMESVSTISTDEELIGALAKIIETEEQKPWDSRDYDLIDEAVEFKLKLEGVDTEECGRRAEKVADRVMQNVRDDRNAVAKRHSGRRRIVYALAAIAALFMLTITTYAFSPSFRDFTNRMYNQLKDKTWYHDDHTDYIITHDILNVSSLDDLAADDRYASLALPYDLPEGYDITGIQASDFGEFQSISIDIQKDGKPCTLSISTSSAEDYGSLDIVRIGEYTVYITETEDGFSGMFNIEETAYQIKADSVETITDIVNSIT